MASEPKKQKQDDKVMKMMKVLTLCEFKKPP